MKKQIGLALLAMALVPAVCAAQDGPWMIRARGVYIKPANVSDAIPSLNVPKDAIHVSTKTIPEVDFSYFFTKNLSAELILTYPQQHDVTLSGTKLGTFKHLPPVLSFQYHSTPQGVVQPYVGVGLNLTLISNVALTVPGVGALDLTSPSVGVAGNIGVDIKLSNQWYANADVKYFTLRSDVELKSGGTKVSKVSVDPWLFGFGLGYRF